MDAVELNCTTGEGCRQPLTDVETAQRETDIATSAAEVQQRAAETAAHQATLSKVAAASGVTVAQLRAALGVPPHE
jgi:hypothetical protein